MAIQLNSPEHRIVTWLKHRERGRTDLFWLANVILAPPESRILVEHAHGPIIDHCQKFAGREEYAHRSKLSKFGMPLIVESTARKAITDLEGERDDMLLVSRGHLKTTINTVAHSIQWILNYPNIRILLATATDDKARMMLGEIRSHFQFNPRFRWFYPEFCADPKKPNDFGSQTEFTVPCRTQRFKEPTVMTAAVGKALASTHHDVIKCSDVVTENNVKTKGQIEEVKEFFGYLDPLREKFESKDGKPSPGWLSKEGTIYDFCLIGETRILMADWTHKPISEIKVGDEVIGWKAPGEKRLKRFLCKSKVIAAGKHESRQTYRYTMESGRSVVSTDSHRWWKGKDWDKGNCVKEYVPLGFKRNCQKSLRSLLVPKAKLNSRDAGWLAGLYDGEGSFQKNKHFPSGCINICQTMHNPEIIEEIRSSLRGLGFQFTETWHQPSKKAYAKPHHQDRCVFNIGGGWKERYRFLAEIGPFRDEKIKESLLGAMMTDRDDLVAVEDAGKQDVYWFQCETGNYIAEGYCSKNSDEYSRVLDEKMAGRMTWCKVTKQSCWLDKAKTQPLWPERFPPAQLHRIMEQIGPILFSSQYELEPVSAESALATREEIHFFPPHIIPQLMPRYRVMTTVDLANPNPNAKAGSDPDFCVFTTAGFDADGRCDVLSIYRKRFPQNELVEMFFLIQKRWPQNSKFKVQKDHYAHALEPMMKREMAKRGEWLNIEFAPISTTVSKVWKIQQLQGWFKMGIIRFADNISCKNELILEVLRFPRGTHDDILDTLSDLFHNKESHASWEVLPDHEKGVIVPTGGKQFTGFDPISKEARWVRDQIEAAHAEYSPMTGAV